MTFSHSIALEAGQGQYHHHHYAGMRIRHLGSSRGNIEYVYDDKSIIDEVVSGTTTNGLYKAEVIHKNGPWKNLEDVEMATLTWVVV